MLLYNPAGRFLFSIKDEIAVIPSSLTRLLILPLTLSMGLSVGLSIGCRGALNQTDTNAPDTNRPQPDTGKPQRDMDASDVQIDIPQDQTPPDMLVMPGPKKPVIHMRRLTNHQLTQSIDEVFRKPINDDQKFVPNWYKLPILNPMDIFSNEVAGLTLGTGEFENLMESSERLAFRMSYYSPYQRKYYVDCDNVDDMECTKRFIKEVGQKLYRRPLSDAEVQSLSQVYQKIVTELEDEKVAYESLLTAMLMSPQTHYLMEPADRALHGYQVASRLSYFLWDGPPDDALYQKAKDGSLLDKAVLRAEAVRMMDDPKFEQAIGLFFYELLDLTRFDAYYKSLSLDKVVNRQAMKQDFFSNIRRHYDETGTLESIFTEENVFVDPLMVAYYSGTYPGILTHPVFQWTHAGYRTTSPIERGVVIRERLLLCGHLPPPPMNVAAIPDTISNDLTGRDRLKQHREDPACSGCHQLIDPLGLPFEGYDFHGLHRTTEHDKPVDVTGGLTGTDQDADVNGPLELQQQLVKSKDMQQCFVDQTLRYALMRKLTPEDDPLRQTLYDSFKRNNLSLRELMLDVATSPVILFPWPEGDEQ